MIVAKVVAFISIAWHTILLNQKTTTIEELRYQKRKDAVDAFRRGELPSTRARVLKVPIRTLFLWLAIYRTGGYDALREGKRSGRPRKVSTEVMEWLYHAISLGDPRQYQFKFCLWTLASIRIMLKREKGVELSKSGVCRLLEHLGLSPQTPIYRSYQRDPKKFKEDLERQYPQLRARAKCLGAKLFFVDEASVRADSHRGTTWAPIGETPIIEDSGQHFGMNMISAVSS